jgi:hypothetical protein
VFCSLRMGTPWGLTALFWGV